MFVFIEILSIEQQNNKDTPTSIHIPVLDDPHGLGGVGLGWKGLNEVAVAPPPSAPKEDDPQGLLLPHWVSNPSRSSKSDDFGLG